MTSLQAWLFLCLRDGWLSGRVDEWMAAWVDGRYMMLDGRCLMLDTRCSILDARMPRCLNAWTPEWMPQRIKITNKPKQEQSTKNEEPNPPPPPFINAERI